MEHKLNHHEYIELNALLKLLGLVDSGGHAKASILNLEVKVNNETETRIRRKLRAGDKVRFGNTLISITS